MSVGRPKDLIPTSQAARLAKVHISGIRRWIREKKIDGWRIGGRWFVSRRAILDRWQHSPAVVPLPATKSDIKRERAEREKKLRAAGVL